MMVPTEEDGSNEIDYDGDYRPNFHDFYDLMKFNLHYFIGVLLLSIIGAILFNKTKTGHLAFSKLTLKIPLFGRMLEQLFLVTFCRTMATLLAAGVSVLEVLKILSTMSGNDVIKTAVIKTREHIVEGSNISMSMIVSGFFPNVAVKMTQVGGVALDLHPLVFVIAGEPFDLFPKHGRVHVVLFKDRLLHVAGDQSAVEIPNQGNHRLGVQRNRHAR